jgi:hypothetical protein
MALNLDEEPLRLPAGTVVLATHPGTVAAHGSPRGRRRGALT